MNLLVKADPAGKPLVDVTPASAGWTHVGFRAVKLAADITGAPRNALYERALSWRQNSA